MVSKMKSTTPQRWTSSNKLMIFCFPSDPLEDSKFTHMDPLEGSDGKQCHLMNGGIYHQNHPSVWWQLKYFFMFTPKIGEDEPNLTSIFFKGVGSTTN